MGVDERATVEHNKAVVRRLFEEFMVKGNGEILKELCDPSYQFWPVVYTAPEGREEHARDNRATLRTIFPDLQASIIEQIGEGDWVATRHMLHGTHLAPMP